ncbi:excinuclease ABC subunit UvrC [Marinicellulosiphila megalodicopiae]|uniref:excinuclease ABC subunit UvrC n=1 Tax=Marinicellulosiphila megalodicopiae TaxID=2724896 RepID=UPI003BB0BBAF
MTKAFDHKSFLTHLTHKPGVYRMFDDEGKLLYVGKAKNLKNRVSSYFRASGLNNKTVALVNKIQSIEVTLTHSETEALLLEHTLINTHRPPYNILLVDDKSYPYIFLSTKHESPGLFIHRGAKKKKGDFFGPFPSALAVRESLSLMQRTFKLRQCEDSVFAHRARPCLQYQIKRCKAPCVDYISKEEYAKDVEMTKDFLSGKSDLIITQLNGEMEQAAMDLNFEQAAQIRDQMMVVQKVHDQQFVAGKEGNVDIFAIELNDKGSCIHFMSVRQGRMLGSKSFFPKLGIESDAASVMLHFLAQFYLLNTTHEVPGLILLNHPIDDAQSLSAALTEKRLAKCKIQSQARGLNQKWIDLATTNAKEQLSFKISQKQTIFDRFESLRVSLGLNQAPQHMECFDISHSHGEATVASCVVFDSQGPAKKHYRSFNIEGVTKGDDVGAMRQAITRRYTRLLKEDKPLPDILLVDGGKGQMNMANEVLEDLGISTMAILAVAKGVTRKPGFETLFWQDTDHIIQIETHNPALHLIQHIRDESHRFAITKHRKQRDKQRVTSALDDIPGIGAARKKALLRRFGSVPNMKTVSLNDLSSVDGVSKKLAQTIYDHLHSA